MNMTTAIITISDACFCEEREDETGPAVDEMIGGIDFERGQIKFILPEGLID